MKRITLIAGLVLYSWSLHSNTAHADVAHPDVLLDQDPIAVDLTKQAPAAVPAHNLSLLNAIQQELKEPHYYKEILPHNFSYLLQLLEYGNQTKQDRQYMQSVISLFSKLLKGSEYVHSTSFSALIDQLPQMLQQHCMVYHLDANTVQKTALNDLDILDRLEKSVTHIIYNKFTTEFSQAQQTPDLFLKDLSAKIVNIANQEISIAQLGQIVIRFLEVGLSKLVWNINEPEKSWESFKTMSHGLASLMEYNIVDDPNDVDELFWTLTHRYCYYLELNSTYIPLDCYAKMKQDIASSDLIVFNLEEQESFMQTKATCMLDTIAAQEAKLIPNEPILQVAQAQEISESNLSLN